MDYPLPGAVRELRASDRVLAQDRLPQLRQESQPELQFSATFRAGGDATKNPQLMPLSH
jgi:hypothetical protein